MQIGTVERGLKLARAIASVGSLLVALQQRQEILGGKRLGALLQPFPEPFFRHAQFQSTPLALLKPPKSPTPRASSMLVPPLLTNALSRSDCPNPSPNSLSPSSPPQSRPSIPSCQSPDRHASHPKYRAGWPPHHHVRLREIL